MVVETAALDAFVDIAHRVVWASVATVDRRGRPRVLHPYWQRVGDGPVGWVFTRPTPLKVAHLAAAPYASCSYWEPAGHESAVAECAADLVDDADTRRLVWDLFENAGPPVDHPPAHVAAQPGRRVSTTRYRQGASVGLT